MRSTGRTLHSENASTLLRHGYGVGVLRLRKNFALRSFHSAQDHRNLEFYVATGASLSFFSLAPGFGTSPLFSLFFSTGYC
jgi:hypothetical protein